MSAITLVGRSTIDLIAGTLVSMISEQIFHKKWDSVFMGKQSETNSVVLAMKSSRVWLQMAFTCLLSYEVRNLYTSADTEDPLGGLMYVLSVAQMPTFWQRVSEVAVILKNKLLMAELPQDVSAPVS